MKIAVVGAGISGLAAARTLHERGDEVVVFEKAAAPGGRCATRVASQVDLPTRGSANLSFNHGAQYFTVRDDSFAETVAYWQRDRIVTNWNARVVHFDGEGWEDVPDTTERYVGVPGMSAIARRMAEGLDIRYGSRVESLAALGTFDRVIVAVPADQAVPLLADSPELAEKAASVTMQPCWAVMAAFEDRVAARFDAAFVSGSALGWVARGSDIANRLPLHSRIDTWVLHATPEWSAAHANDQADVVAPFLLRAFDDLVRAGLPRVFHLAAHRWRYATANPCLAMSALHDHARRISVCGDWCLGPRIESAYLSGLAAAIP